MDLLLGKITSFYLVHIMVLFATNKTDFQNEFISLV